MKERTIYRFVVAVPECAREKFESVLASIGYEPDVLTTSGGEAIEAAQGARAMVLTTFKLGDMTGAELAQRLGEEADVLMVVPGDYEEDEERDGGVQLLRNPITPDALVQALRATAHMQKKCAAWQARAKKAERTLEERKVIDRAKGRMMDELKMSEKQAHYLIQKKSMDLGKRIAEVAQEILEAETLEGLM